jgi:hypothetical protein
MTDPAPGSWVGYLHQGLPQSWDDLNQVKGRRSVLIEGSKDRGRGRRGLGSRFD